MNGRTVIMFGNNTIICVDDMGVYGIGDNSGPIKSFECKGYKYLANKKAWAKQRKFYHFSEYNYLGDMAKFTLNLPMPFPC